MNEFIHLDLYLLITTGQLLGGPCRLKMSERNQTLAQAEDNPRVELMVVRGLCERRQAIPFPLPKKKKTSDPFPFKEREKTKRRAIPFASKNM